MIGILRDVRYGMRLLAAKPGFATVALLTAHPIAALRCE